MKDKLNLKRGVIYETIISTYSPDDTPNSAPIGIKYLGEGRVQARIYKGSQTLNNILSRRCAVANLTSDPILFYLTALKRGKHPPVEYSKSENVDAPRIREVDGHIELELVDSRQGSEYATLNFKVKAIYLAPGISRIYCRAPHALVEATIHATRIKMLLAKNRFREAERLIRLVNHYKDVIERVSPKTEYATAIREIEKKIGEWRKGRGLGQDPCKTTCMSNRYERGSWQSRRKSRSSHR